MLEKDKMAKLKLLYEAGLIGDIEYREKQFQLFLEDNKAYISLYQDSISEISKGIEEYLQGNKDALKDSFKNVILLALDVLKKQAQISIAGATIQSLASPDSVLTWGVAGFEKAAFLAGLIEVAFAAVKSQVMQFDTGKYPVIGARDGKSYNPDYVGAVQTGYYSKPSLGLFAEAGPEIVIDTPTVRNLEMNYPDIIQGIYRARVPQYAEGKYPSASSSSMPQSISFDNNALNIFAQMLEELRKPKKNYVPLTDIEKATDTKKVILGKVTRE
jgi:hypothetical protein